MGKSGERVGKSGEQKRRWIQSQTTSSCGTSGGFRCARANTWMPESGRSSGPGECASCSPRARTRGLTVVRALLERATPGTERRSGERSERESEHAHESRAQSHRALPACRCSGAFEREPVMPTRTHSHTTCTRCSKLVHSTLCSPARGGGEAGSAARKRQGDPPERWRGARATALNTPNRSAAWQVCAFEMHTSR